MKQTLVKALVIANKREYSWWLDGIDVESIESPLLDISELRVATEGFEWSLLPLVKQQPDVLLLDSTLSAPFLLRIALQVRETIPNLPVLLLPNIRDEADASQSLAKFPSELDTTNSQPNRGVRHERKFITDTIVRAVRYARGRQQLQSRLLQMALKDDLTQLHNRRGFMVLAKQQLKWAHDTGQHLLLFFADLDGLKRINDQFGHHEGDHALSLAAASIKNTFRRSDVTARLSGDEFVALIAQEPGRVATSICQRLQVNLANYAAAECNYKLTLSIGVAHFNPDHPTTLQELMKHADAALYQQKHIAHCSLSASSRVDNSATLPHTRKHFLSADSEDCAENTHWLPSVAIEPTIRRVQP